MKKNIFLAAFAIAGAAAYFLTRKRTPEIRQIVERENPKKHHLTKVFSKAKQIAVNE